ncbi:tyrosine-type recombinase/integrase [Paenibacillus chitinolyticus]|uniref:tyrosine-type recombinase/integrase n=1 Tax=Paenibacillus chitinolyticus TaxID=79263 RepID=UPI001C4918A8|nr:tyrosine-type recombinase/integrase [Paenibacillus chitinolyticus]MBV6717246.1 tyrosine-type recombinase/integrase [Paenibacillus chitinolyticus]
METTRKKVLSLNEDDHLEQWLSAYLKTIYEDSQDPKKIERCLNRFYHFYLERYEHDKVTGIVKRDIQDWLSFLYKPEKDGGAGYAASYVNSHHSALAGFIKWLRAAAPHLMPKDPMKGIREIMLPDPEPRTLTPQQILSLKNICDRLDRFHAKKDRRRAAKTIELKKYARPNRDRAIVYVFLSTGLRREELVMLDIDQVIPSDPELLRQARSARIVKIRGKGKTEGTEYLSAEARSALADYLEHERGRDAIEGETTALFLSASGRPKRKDNGRLHPRTINKILEQIGQWHDNEIQDPARHISPLCPHDLRHTFANEIAKKPGVTEQDLVRLLRHRSKRYISLYTNPPAERTAGLIEDL